MDTSKVTRFEVIDHRPNGLGRVLSFFNEKLKVELSLQDEGRTLRVFVEEHVQKDPAGKS